ncbi:MAG: radical SAM protein, partial [Candidatus Omnitrophota bacterium]|nr:radical SAM protein [Candidatus Omnitrophota bacterium]
MSPLIKDKERLDLILVITYQCNLNCPYCNIKLDRNKHMDFKTAKRALDLFLEHKANSSTTNYIKFSGAEPLLRISLLKEIVGYVKQQGPTNIKFLLGTNGILLDKESLDWINNNDIELSISYDGSKDLKSFNLKPPYPPDVIVNMVIMPSQAEGCFDNFLYLYNKGFKCFNFLPAAYTFWPAANTEQLRKNLGKISLFIKKEGYSKFYIK